MDSEEGFLQMPGKKQTSRDEKTAPSTTTPQKTCASLTSSSAEAPNSANGAEQAVNLAADLVADTPDVLSTAVKAEYVDDVELVLGFLDSSETHFGREKFPSKIGGRPVFLYSKAAPAPTCGSCSRQLRFLLQLYAPVAAPHGNAFHRTLYLYVCGSAGCAHSSGCTSVRVLRAQLPRRNDMYPYNAGDESEVTPVEGTCALCGGAASSRCAGCAGDAYCGRTCQREDWRLGHKAICQIRRKEINGDTRELLRELGEKRRSALFREFGVETEAWSDAESDDDSSECESDQDEGRETDGKGSDGYAVENSLDAEATANSGSDKEKDALLADKAGKGDVWKQDDVAVDENALAQKMAEKAGVSVGTMQDADAEELPEDMFKSRTGKRDAVFERFCRVTREPADQVIRYTRGGQCVWAHSKGQYASTEGRCRECGGELIFEFEVLPQLLYYLEQDGKGNQKSIQEIAEKLRNAVDWGVIAVFTCRNSCDIGGRYVEETAWLQRAP